jgi:GNAT superfamily N-acetyltransferase
MIIEFNKEHINKSVEVHRNSFKENPWNEDWSKEASFERIEDLFNTPKFYGLIDVDNDEIRAVIMGHFERMHDGLYYFLNEMFVSPFYKHNGIGSSLIKALEERLKEKNCKLIFFFTSKELRVSDFYEKNGYKVDSEMSMMEKFIK